MDTNTLPAPFADENATLWATFQQALADNAPGLSIAPEALKALQTAFAFSRYVAQTCLQQPDLAENLIASGDLMHPLPEDAFMQRGSLFFSAEPLAAADLKQAEAASETSRDRPVPWGADLSPAEFQKRLRRFRHHEMIRIAVRDLARLADLDATMAELSALAAGCIQLALDYEYERLIRQWGLPLDDAAQPQHMVILGLGKLGAGELNFSSDVDLIFAFPHNGQTQGGPKGDVSSEAFFERLCRNLIQTIGAHTAEGFVFRVDTRLRPYGEAGPMVMTFDRLEDYYEEQGREWERYALIKARAVAGDIPAGKKLLERLKPFVFRRYLDFGAFDSLREMKGRIVAEVRQKGLDDNIKLGAGGIREVEFFGQMFQLIRGGVDPDLQIRSIRRVLQLLAQKGHIPDSAKNELDTGYVFLRLVENRLQQWQDQQTHLLPTTGKDRQRLALCMGFTSWADFEPHLRSVRHRIHYHFETLLAAEKREKLSAAAEGLQVFSALWQGVLDEETAREELTRLGYADFGRVWEEIKILRNDRILKTLSATGRRRLDQLVPLTLQTVAAAEAPEIVLGLVFNLIKSIQKRASYLALLLENPSALGHLVRLSDASPWIATFLCQHPVLLDELLDPRTLYRPPQKAELIEEIRQRLTAAEEDDLEYQMEILRVFKQVNILRVAASDITHVLPLMKVSDHLTEIAEIILDKVVSLCWHNLNHKYGTPVCKLRDAACDRGFIVVGYGKLGGLELGYGSDLDLVFLHAAQSGETRGGPRAIDGTLFFGRLGQRVLHMLSTHTAAGILYPTDMRLRPSGASGMLVSHLDGFRDYQHNDAWTWEHQALIRARPITGDMALQEQFTRIRHEILTIQRDDDRLREEVSHMRARLREAEAPSEPHVFHLKQGVGGIVDIEFLVQYLVLRHAHAHPEIVRWTDNVRLLQALNEAGILDNSTAFGLRRAYLVYRAMVHRCNLRQLSAQVDDDRFALARRFVRDVWNQILIPIKEN